MFPSRSCATSACLALLLFSQNGNRRACCPSRLKAAAASTLYTILFILCFGIGYGAYYATADMPIPMVADCSDYETYRSGKYIPGIMGTMFSLVDKLVSSLAQTLVAFIFLLCAGMSELPTDSTPYSVGIKGRRHHHVLRHPDARVDRDARRHEGLQPDRRKDEGDSGCQRRAQEGDCLRMTLEQSMETYKTLADVEKQ